MKAISCLTLLASLSASSTVFSVNGSVSGNAKFLDLDGLKAKCAELSADEQLKPFKAVVSCRQTLLEWRPAEKQAAPVMIENVKQVGATLTLKSYSVPFQAEDVEVSPSQASCQLWEQHRITVPAVDIELDCDALAKVSSLTELCSPAIDQHLASDPAIQQIEATGNTFDSCRGR